MGVEPLVACKPGSEFEKYCVQKGWPHHPLPMASSADLRSGWQLKKLCKTHRVYLVHAHSSHGHGTAFTAYLLGNRTPVVLTRRVDFEVGKNWLSRYKYTFPRLKRIACVSKAIQNIVDRGTQSPERTTTIYSAIDSDRFLPHIGSDYLRQKYRLALGTTLIGNTSALAPHKDYFTFADTAEHYLQNHGRDVRFFVIGEGAKEAEIKDYVARRQLDEYFIFTGFLKNIEQVLPSLDIFLMPSKTEGLGTSVIDAFAAKVPVVATRAGGIPELVRHMETGLLAEIGDAASLADHLAHLQQDPELRDRLVAKAHEYSLEFDTSQMARRYHHLYQATLSAP